MYRTWLPLIRRDLPGFSVRFPIYSYLLEICDLTHLILKTRFVRCTNRKVTSKNGNTPNFETIRWKMRRLHPENWCRGNVKFQPLLSRLFTQIALRLPEWLWSASTKSTRIDFHFSDILIFVRAIAGKPLKLQPFVCPLFTQIEFRYPRANRSSFSRATRRAFQIFNILIRNKATSVELKTRTLSGRKFPKNYGGCGPLRRSYQPCFIKIRWYLRPLQVEKSMTLNPLYLGCLQRQSLGDREQSGAPWRVLQASMCNFPISYFLENSEGFNRIKSVLMARFERGRKPCTRLGKADRIRK